MRPFALLPLILAVLLTAALSLAHDPIIIYGNDSKPPKSWMENGHAKGILVDILNEVAARTGLSFDIRLTPWKRAYMNALEDRGGLIGLSKNKERTPLFDFSEVVYVDEMRLVVLRGHEFPYHSVEDLKGKTLGVTRGASYGDAYDHAKQKLFYPSEDSGTVSRLRMLLAGRIDAALVGPGAASVRFAIKRDKVLMDNRDKFVVLPIPFNQDDNYIGFTKTMQQSDNLRKIDQALREMHRDGTICKIEARY